VAKYLCIILYIPFCVFTGKSSVRSSAARCGEKKKVGQYFTA